jgi:hypothetical protein
VKTVVASPPTAPDVPTSVQRRVPERAIAPKSRLDCSWSRETERLTCVLMPLMLQYLVIKNALSDETVAELNDRFDRQLRDEKPEGALSWYLDRERDHVQPDGTLSPRTLWHKDLILPEKVEPILTELCSSFEWVRNAVTPCLSLSFPLSTRRTIAAVCVTLLHARCHRSDRRVIFIPIVPRTRLAGSASTMITRTGSGRTILATRQTTRLIFQRKCKSGPTGVRILVCTRGHLLGSSKMGCMGVHLCITYLACMNCSRLVKVRVDLAASS